MGDNLNDKNSDKCIVDLNDRFQIQKIKV